MHPAFVAFPARELMMLRIASTLVVSLGLLVPSVAAVSAQSETMMYDHVHLAVPEPATAAAWYSRHFGGDPVHLPAGGEREAQRGRLRRPPRLLCHGPEREAPRARGGRRDDHDP